MPIADCSKVLKTLCALLICVASAVYLNICLWKDTYDIGGGPHGNPIFSYASQTLHSPPLACSPHFTR